ncbi:dirigent protein 17 [Phtheirospermum japonicum]|uniref:Dirigent protein 17 n=1 Tax=Phtheirospermum japonicum TaxID=374723 RepID=A0A830BG31_9LAMI|nr:dirigent protein 17 [Phtheirospermum japonicum]
MENGDFIDSSSAEIFKIPNEPAIVINELPPLSSPEPNLVPCAISDVLPQEFAGFGEWLEGREVRKLFEDQYFNGKVTQFDEDMGWYRVVYEDGDFEDLEWHELMDVLVPLDVNIPLKTLATKIIKKRQKFDQKTEKVKVRARNYGKAKGKESG